MGSLERVEVRTSRSTSIGVVAKLVDVEAALSVGIIALDLVFDGGRSGLGVLRELDPAGNAGVTAENSYWGGVSDAPKLSYS